MIAVLTKPTATQCENLQGSPPPSSKSSIVVPKKTTKKRCATPTGRPTGFPFCDRVISFQLLTYCLLSFTFLNSEFLSFVPFHSTFILVTRRLEELHLFTFFFMLLYVFYFKSFSCQLEASKSKVFLKICLTFLYVFVIFNRFFLTFGCFICLMCRDTV